MFVSDTHLPQSLSSDAYDSEAVFQTEIERLFLPGWHCVGTTAEFERDGDYQTIDLFGRPVLIRWNDGEFAAFLNVCPHRFSKLSDSWRGNLEPLRCPYHGWEFGSSGDVRKIPDAGSFKPLEKGQLCLKRFQVETIGQLIFVTLADDPQPLREFLGGAYATLCENWFSEEYDFAFSYLRPNRSNWKISLENSLEGYHNAAVHGKTYRSWPDASACTHEMPDASRSAFKVDAEQEDTFLTRLGKAAYRLAGVEPEFDFHEIHRYPHLVFAKFSKFTWVETVIPISATDSIDLWFIFCKSGRNQGLRARLLSLGMRIWFKRFFLRILREDEAMFPLVQAGAASPERPGPGLISIREERIFHFQNYLRESESESTD